MESSGVFTDVEQQKIPDLQFDMSPDDRSTDTLQSNTESTNSQKVTQDQKAINGDNYHHKESDIAEEEKQPDNNNNDENKNFDSNHHPLITSPIQGGVQIQSVEKSGSLEHSEQSQIPGKSSGKRMSSKSRRSNSSSPPFLKKNKMAPEQPPEQQKPAKPKVVRLVKKTPNKWDAVMNKISHKTTPQDYSEVKSRVNCPRTTVTADQERNNSAASIASHTSSVKSRISPRYAATAANEKENSVPAKR